jgi:glycine dehydrogenase subunit 1
MALLGENGFRDLARLNHEAAIKTADELSKIKGVKVLNDAFFNEFVVELPKPAAEVVDKLAGAGIIAGYPLEDGRLLVAATEMTTDEDIETFAAVLEEVLA